MAMALISGSSVMAASPLYLYAAASLRTPLESIATDFTSKTGEKVVLAIGRRGAGDCNHVLSPAGAQRQNLSGSH